MNWPGSSIEFGKTDMTKRFLRNTKYHVYRVPLAVARRDTIRGKVKRRLAGFAICTTEPQMRSQCNTVLTHDTILALVFRNSVNRYKIVDMSQFDNYADDKPITMQVDTLYDANCHSKCRHHAIQNVVVFENDYWQSIQ